MCVSLHPNVRPRSIFVVYYLFTCFPFLHSVSIVDPYFGASMVRRYVGTLVLGDLWGVHLQIFECFIFVIVPWDMSHPTPSHFHISTLSCMLCILFGKAEGRYDDCM